MKLTALAVAAVASATSTVARWDFAPTPVGGVFICRDFGWGGPCTRLVLPIGMCVVLNKQWNDTISTVDPDPNIIATGFDEPTCTGAGARWNITTEDTTGATFGNDRISAFMLTVA